MTFDRYKHHRQSIRLKGYDYSAVGSYFLTVCTWNREYLFGTIVYGEMKLNEIGFIVGEEWLKSVDIRRELRLDEFVIMPNHIHAIVTICDSTVGATGRSPLPGSHNPSPPIPNGPKPKSIGSFMAGFRSAATKRINILRNSPELPVWQRNYYEHIIRNQDEFDRIRHYIISNPMNWNNDKENY